MKPAKQLNVIGIIFLAFVFLFASTRPAHAYLDPGSLGFITQVIIAGVAGSIYFIATSWGRIKTFISNLFKKNKPKGKSAN